MPTTTNYIWDEDNLLAESDGTNTINVVYTNEPERFGNLISTRIGASTLYHHFDEAVGSTRQLTNPAAHVTDTIVYDAGGNQVARTGTTPIAFTWIGQFGYYFDAEMGSYSAHSREYSPAIARWWSFDPLLFIDSLNLFIYAFNCPMLFIDPFGLQVQGQTQSRPGSAGPRPPTTRGSGSQAGSRTRSDSGRSSRSRPGSKGFSDPGPGAPGRRSGSSDYEGITPGTGSAEGDAHLDRIYCPPSRMYVDPLSGVTLCFPDPPPSPPEPIPLEEDMTYIALYHRRRYKKLFRDVMTTRRPPRNCPKNDDYQCHHLVPQGLWDVGPFSLTAQWKDQCENLCCLPQKLSHSLTLGGNNWYNNFIWQLISDHCGAVIKREYIHDYNSGKGSVLEIREFNLSAIEAADPQCVANVRDLLKVAFNCCPMKSCCPGDSPCKKCCKAGIVT